MADKKEKQVGNPVDISKLRRATDYVGEDMDLADLRKIDDCLDTDYVCHAMTTRKGKHGEYMIFELIEPDTGAVFHVQTGGVAIMDKGARLMETAKFPFILKFTYNGNYYNLG